MSRVASQLTRLEARIAELSAKLPSQGQETPRDDKETFTHLLQLQDRLMVELKAFGRKLDTANVRLCPSFPLAHSLTSLRVLNDRANPLPP